MSTTETMSRGRRELAAWLRSSDGGEVLDCAVMGCWPLHDAEELLEDFGVEVSRESLRWLGRAINEALGEGN